MYSEDCLVCYKIVDDSEQAIACIICDNWYHVKCIFKIKVSKLVHDHILAVTNISWTCNSCLENVNVNQKPVPGQVDVSGSVHQFRTAFKAVNVKAQTETVTKTKETSTHSSSPRSKKSAPSLCPRSDTKIIPQPANDSWEIVKVKKRSFKNKSTLQEKSIKLTNRFKLLDISPTNDKAEGNAYNLIGDSIIRGQGSDFRGRKKKKCSTFCRPGAKLDDITAMVHDINGNQIHDDKELIIHVGTNDMVKPPEANKYRNRAIPQRASESIYGKYKNLVQELRNRNTKSYVVGMLPRFKVTNELNSRILSMNSRVQQLCKEAGIGYIDMFTKFQDNSNLFTSDGLHLSYQGKKLYAEILKFNINNFGN